MTDQPTTHPAPRRLVPQRKSKSIASANKSSDVKPDPIPIDLSMDAGVTHDIHEDDTQQITQTMADWTLNGVARVQEAQDMSVEDDTSEEQSYHGEIESHESSDEEESDVSHETIQIPDGYASISLDDISTSPPPSMPLVLVNLESLCGYKPDISEREVLISQITDALYADTAEETDGDIGKSDGEGLEFDTRVTELFESGVGSHIDSNADVVQTIKALDERPSDDAMADGDVTSLAIIPYPEFLTDSTTLQSTARLWKLLYKPHPLPLVERIFRHLRNTSQSLLWKTQMHNELRDMVILEYKAKMSRLARDEYEEWKAVRKEKLEKLYEVRETILLRVNVAKARYEKHVEDRERRVDIEMTRRRGDLWVESKKAAELEAQKDAIDDPFEIDQESYDDDGWGGAIKEVDIIGEPENFVMTEYCPDDDDDDEGSDREEWSPVKMSSDNIDPLGMNIVVNDTVKTEECEQDNEEVSDKRLLTSAEMSKLEPITSNDNMQRKTNRLEKAAQQFSSRNSMSEEEAAVRARLKTTDELMAEAMLRNLQDRLDGVDNLLESIQEEEWADEEGADEPDDQSLKNELGKPNPDQPGMTLLDRILAMILGALSQAYTGATSKEEHFKFVKKEHDSIAAEWKRTFGRLPPTITSSGVENDMQKDFDTNDTSVDNFRVFENNDQAWDEVDWDSLMP